jgi:alkylation response protein AidB-like acyl-CoA dehydrogenase
VQSAGDRRLLWSDIVGLDWPALGVPEELGGLGLGRAETSAIAWEMGRSLAPVPWLSTTSMFAPPVLASAADEQRQRFGGAIARGMTGALAAPEGGDVFASQGSVVATRSGESWRLGGRVQCVLLDDAVEVVVPARVGNAGGPLELFVVSVDDLVVQRLDALDRTQGFADVACDDCAVDDRRRLEIKDPEQVLTATLQEAVLTRAASAVGTCEVLFERSMHHLRERRQFGVPIGSFQALKHQAADMFVELERARALVLHAVLSSPTDSVERELTSCMAKAAVGDCERTLAHLAFKIHGAMGYTVENDLHLWLIRAKHDGAFLGTARQHYARITHLLRTSRGEDPRLAPAGDLAASFEQ